MIYDVVTKFNKETNAPETLFMYRSEDGEAFGVCSKNSTDYANGYYYCFLVYTAAWANRNGIPNDKYCKRLSTARRFFDNCGLHPVISYDK